MSVLRAAVAGAIALFCIVSWNGRADAAQYASIVIDAASGAIIESVNAHVQTYPASLTKMMTLYLTFDSLDDVTLKPGQLPPLSYHPPSHSTAQPPSGASLLH